MNTLEIWEANGEDSKLRISCTDLSEKKMVVVLRNQELLPVAEFPFLSSSEIGPELGRDARVHILSHLMRDLMRGFTRDNWKFRNYIQNN